MSVYVLPYSATMQEIKHYYTTGNGRIVWTYKGKARSREIKKVEAKPARNPL